MQSFVFNTLFVLAQLKIGQAEETTLVPLERFEQVMTEVTCCSWCTSLIKRH